ERRNGLLGAGVGVDEARLARTKYLQAIEPAVVERFQHAAHGPLGLLVRIVAFRLAGPRCRRVVVARARDRDLRLQSLVVATTPRQRQLRIGDAAELLPVVAEFTQRHARAVLAVAGGVDTCPPKMQLAKVAVGAGFAAGIVAAIHGGMKIEAKA